MVVAAITPPPLLPNCYNNMQQNKGVRKSQCNIHMPHAHTSVWPRCKPVWHLDAHTPAIHIVALIPQPCMSLIIRNALTVHKYS